VLDALESTCLGDFDAAKKDGTVHLEPIEGSMSGIFGNLNI
jgi:hypothetical protein